MARPSFATLSALIPLVAVAVAVAGGPPASAGATTLGGAGVVSQPASLPADGGITDTNRDGRGDVLSATAATSVGVGESRAINTDLRFVAPFTLIDADVARARTGTVAFRFSITGATNVTGRTVQVVGLRNPPADLTRYQAAGTLLGSVAAKVGTFTVDATAFVRQAAADGIRSITFRVQLTTPAIGDALTTVVWTAANEIGAAKRPALVITIPNPVGCPVAATPVNEAALPVAVPESSGLVVDRAQPGVIWTFNDNGNGPEVFAVERANGRLLATITLSGATNQDWEDISWGPAPAAAGPGAGPWLYVGDGGYPIYASPAQLYRFAPPAVAPGQAPVTLTIAPERLLVKFQSPNAGTGGIPDVEAWVIDPVTGDAIFVEKKPRTVAGVERRSLVYRVPAAALVPDAVAVAVPETAITGSSYSASVGATAADISADGSTIVVKSIDEVRLWTRLPGQSVIDAFAAAPDGGCVLGSPVYGEAIGLLPDGHGVVVTAEGAASMIRRVTWS